MEQRNNFIVLSGNLCTGKTSLAKSLNELNNFKLFMTREILKKLAPPSFLSKYHTEREGLINYSIELDKNENGQWIADNISLKTVSNHNIIVDSIRLISQLRALDNKFKPISRFFHIHLKCTDEILSQRFAARNENKRENITNSIHDFYKAKEHIIELQSSELEVYADMVIITDMFSSADIYNQVIGRILF